MEIISFILWLLTVIWFTRRMDSIAKATERTAVASEALLLMKQRTESKERAASAARSFGGE